MLGKSKLNTFYWVSIIFITINLVIIFASTIISRKIFGEWDGVMHYFSGLYFIQTGIYTGWASHYWPPLQSLILSLGNAFIFGKIASAVLGILTLMIVFYLSNNYLKDKKLSLLVVLYVFSCTLFLQIFSFVENHSLETFFFLASVLFFLNAHHSNSKVFFLVSGLFCGFACISRYTSYSLALSLIFINIFSRPKGIWKNFYFLLGFITINAPWWLLNFITNGNPLHTWQFTNIGLAIYPSDNHSEFNWIHQNEFDGLLDLVFKFPKEFMLNILKNFVKGIISIILNISSIKILSIVLFPLLVFHILKYKNFKIYFYKNKYILFISFSFISICSIAFHFPEALAPIIFLVIIYSIIYSLNKVNYFKFYLICLIICNSVVFFKESRNILSNEMNDPELSDLEEVTKVLLRNKKKDDVLMSIHPAHAYYTKMNWVMYPLKKNIKLCDLVDYDLPKKILNWVPKYPVNLTDYSVDYVIVNTALLKYCDYIDSTLQLPTVDCNIYNFRVLYKSKNVTLYKVTR